jgi:hypothetical protein
VTLSLKAIRRISSAATKFPWFVAGHKTDDSHNETCRKATAEEKAKLCIRTDKEAMEQNISHEFHDLHRFKRLSATSCESQKLCLV